MSTAASAGSLVIPSIHYLAILPVLIFFGASLALLVTSALVNGKVTIYLATAVTSLASLAVLGVSAFQWAYVARHGASTTVAHAVVLDGFAVVGTVAIAASVLLATFVAHDWAKRERIAGADFHILALASSAGALLMVQANDLIVIFLGLEILSIGLYVLVGFDRERTASSEASLKYFLLGGFASAIFIYGAALVYGATGSTNLSSISYFLAANVVLKPGLLYAGGALLLVGFAFKVAAVPFHLWSPDVYEGAPTPVTGVMASIVKVGAFAALLRVLISALGTQLDTWRPILFVLVVVTCVVGASVALVQRNVKRLLAYSSINQAGFMMLGVWSGSARGVAATLFYVLTYAPVVIATFAVVTLIGGRGDEQHSIDHYRGLARRQPWLGGALALLLLSQLGAPLTVGFYAKYTVLAATIDSGGGALALVAILLGRRRGVLLPALDPRPLRRRRRGGHARARPPAHRQGDRRRRDRHGPVRALARADAPRGASTRRCSSCREPRRARHEPARRVTPTGRCLSDALASAGVHGELVVWDDPSSSGAPTTSWSLRSTWDYAGRGATSFSPGRKGVRHLHNPTPVRRVLDGQALPGRPRAHGLAVVPSYFCNVGKKPRLLRRRGLRGEAVRSGPARWTPRATPPANAGRPLEHVKRLHAQGRDVVIQPYVHSVDTLGERAMIFVDGQYSHAMTKGAMLNVDELDRSQLFRREQMSLATGELDAIEFATKVLETKGLNHLLYARVDLVATIHGWWVMELELVEPSLFLTFEPSCATRLAHAIAKRLS